MGISGNITAKFGGGDGEQTTINTTSIQTNEENIAVLALRQVVTATQYVDSIADDYSDETGVNTGTTTANYSSALEYYSSAASGSLLIQSNTTDGSTTFVDSSTNTFTINAVGDVQHDTDQAKFGTTSILFDGTGDELNVSDDAEFEFGSGDFTVDFWLRVPNVSGTKALFSKTDNSTNESYVCYLNTSNLSFDYSTDGSTLQTTIASSGGEILSDTWYHIAVIAESGNLFMYVDGVEVATGALSGAFYDGTAPFRVGAAPGTTDLNGWIDEFRVAKGLVRWTTTFTPPAASYTGGTQQLLIQSNTTDGSTTFTDSGVTGHTVTANGDVQHDTDQQKFGTSSILFDGTGDRLTISDSTDFAFGSGDFTIDCWMRLPDTTGTHAIFAQWVTPSDRAVYLRTNGANLQFIYSTNGSTETIITASSVLTANTWQHIAVSRNNDSLGIFVDGDLVSRTDFTGITIFDSTSDIEIGSTVGGAEYMNGWLDEIRVLKGTGAYASDFTPPTTTTSNNENFLLRSTTFTAEAAPDNARLVILHEPVDSVTLNTDLIAKISRDGFTSDTTLVLEDQGPFDSSINILSCALTDISAQPSGVSMIYDLETFNNKEQRVHGAWLQWS